MPRLRTMITATLIAVSTAPVLAAPAAADPSLPQVTVTKPCHGVVAFSAADRTRLIRLSDPDMLAGPAQALDHIEQIADLLVARGDRRGIFAVFYRNILRVSVPALEDRTAYDDHDWVVRLTEDFFERYLQGLHASVSGEPIPSAWRTFYRQAADCSVRPGRVAMAGLDAHLILDFPASLAAMRTTKANAADYYDIGSLLQEATVQIAAELNAVYGADLREFFHLWFFGDALDAATGRGTATTLLFQGIRTVAFTYGLGLRDPWKRFGTQIAMQATYAGAEAVSGALAAARLI